VRFEEGGGLAFHANLVPRNPPHSLPALRADYTSGHFLYAVENPSWDGGALCAAAGGGMLGLAADASAPGGAAAATLFATAFDGGKLLSWSAAAGAVRTLRAAPASTSFRGVALAPCTACAPMPTPAPSAAGGGAVGASPAGVAAGVLLPLAAVAAGGWLLVRRSGGVGAAAGAAKAWAKRALLGRDKEVRGPLLVRAPGKRLSPEQARARASSQGKLVAVEYGSL